MKALLVLGGTLLLLLGCSSPPQKLDETKLYARTMDFNVNGVPYVGSGVVPANATGGAFDIEIVSKNDMDLVTIKSCARDWWGEKVGAGGGILFWKKENKFTYRFEPDRDLELGKPCPLELASYNVKGGAHAWAYLDFDWSPGWSLPATLTCNARRVSYGGVSVCENREGLPNRYFFQTEVIVNPGSAGEGCKFGDEDFLRGTEFIIPAPYGVCHYTFMETGPGRRKHRTTIWGYSDIVIKEQ